MDKIVSIIQNNLPPKGNFNKRIYCFPNIPEDILTRAHKTYTSNISDETPLLLIDLSPHTFIQRINSGDMFLFFAKPGSFGLLITDKAIYDGSLWEHDEFFSDRFWYKDEIKLNYSYRRIPLQLIFNVKVGDSFTGKDVLMINGIPMFGKRPFSWDGLNDNNFLHWLSTLIGSISSEVRGNKHITIEDLILSYKGYLHSRELYYYDEITEEKIKAARRRFVGNLLENEKILFLYPDGFAITTHNIFTYVSGQSAYLNWKLSDIQKVRILASRLGKNADKFIVINDMRVYGWPHEYTTKYGYVAKYPLEDPSRANFLLASLIYQISLVKSNSLNSDPPVYYTYERSIKMGEIEKNNLKKITE